MFCVSIMYIKQKFLSDELIPYLFIYLFFFFINSMSLTRNCAEKRE